MARNKKVEILSHDGQVLHPITDGDCVIFPDGETLARKLSEQEEVMYTPEVVNSSPMFKVGEGDSSDYSANVLDGAYQEAVLKGQTYVNTIQEPSADVITLPTPFTEYERTQSKTFTEMQDGTFGLNLVGQSYVNCIQEPSEPSYVALGENLEFQNKKVEYTTDGQIKSAMLNGMTLVNIFTRANKGHHHNVTNNGKKGFTMTGDGTVTCHSWWNLELSTTKQYILTFDINVNTADQVFLIKGNDEQTITYFPIGTTGKQTVIFTPTASDIRFKVEQYVNGTVIVDNIMLMEYQQDMENWDIPYFQGMQSVTMTTELENVCSRYNSSTAKNGKTFTVGAIENRVLTLSTSANIGLYNFKPNTKYLMQFKITNLNLDGLDKVSLTFSNSTVSTGDSLFGNNADIAIDITKNGIYRTVLTTTNVISTSQFLFKGVSSEWENSTSTSRKLTISQIMCIEYQNGMENWDLPYFETTQLIKPLKVQSVNKNLLNKEIIVDEHSSHDYLWTKNYRSKPALNIKHNTTYTLSLSRFNGDGKVILWSGENKTREINIIISQKGLTFTTASNEDGFSFYAAVGENGDALSQTVQLEESSTSTDYVPHQSKTTSALEPITLRAIGDVKDTLDLSTGEYVQRIGEVVFDGSNDENWGAIRANNINGSGGGLDYFRIPLSTLLKTTNQDNIPNSIINDKIKVVSYNTLFISTSLSESLLMSTVYSSGLSIQCVYIYYNNSSNVSEFKTYLSQNPIKVQYILANPITRKISLEYPNLQTYTDITHVQSIAMDGTLIPKIFLPSDISYKAMLKPNTSYNVIVDREVIDSTNQLTVNLGGTTANITANRTVVRTPSTLSNEILTFSGKDNRIAKAMLIEGSTLINGDLPHFDGIGDVKLGRVVENLCMSNETLAGDATVTSTLYTDRIELKITKVGSAVECFKLNKQLINGKKYFVYSPSTTSNTTTVPIQVGFRHFYNNVVGYARQVATMPSTGKLIFTMDENYQINPYTDITIGNHSPIPVNTTMSIRRPIICEYIDGMENWDWESIGYFTGTRNIGNEFMRIGNKNLFDGNFYGGYINSINNGIVELYGSTTVYKTVQLNLKKGTYTISFPQICNIVRICENYNFNIVSELAILKYTFTMSKDGKYAFSFRKTDATDIPNNFEIQIEEASSATSYVAHKHNSLHILPNEQIPLTFVQGGIYYTKGDTWTNAINNTNTARIRTQLFDLEPNETYRISCGNNTYNFAVYSYDNSLLGISDTAWLHGEYYINTTKDIHKIAIAIRKADNSNLTPSVLHQVRLEKVTDVTLRSVGNVKDELDLTRGVYIQRINEVVLNGSENWVAEAKNSNVTSRFSLKVNDMLYENINTVNKNNLNASGVFPVLFNGSDDQEQIFSHNGAIHIRINDSKLNVANDVDSFKAYLQSNPITVQYKLTTPIEHKVHIPMKNELNQTIAKPNGIFTLPLMYSETNHIDINSQIYPKVQSRDYIAYPVIASPSNKYTVFHNKVGSTDLTVNLCGASTTVNTHKNTITTPSSITQYELRLSGANNKVSNVCVFNGDYMNVNVPYVQGMMNAVNPIVKNTGKNLMINEFMQGYYQGSDGAYTSNHSKFITTANLIPVNPNTVYIQSSSLDITHGAITFFDKNKKYIRQRMNSLKTLFTTPSDCYYVAISWWKNEGLNPQSIEWAMLEQSSTSSQYEPYKENNCKPDYGQIKLTKDMFEQGSFNELSSVKNYYETKTATSHNLQLKRIRLIDPIPVKPNTKYIVKFNGLEDYDIFVAYFKNNERVGFEGYWKNKEFTTSSDCNQIVFVLKRKGDAQILVDDIDYSKLIFSKVDETIHLRSLPNGVRDELNLETGEYIQRIGEVVLDGDETVVKGIDDTNYINTIEFYIDSVINSGSNKNSICDSYVYKYKNEDIEHFYTDNKRVVVFIDKTKLLSQDVNGFKEWLSKNPMVVQYQLKTPIIKQIDIHNYPHSYQNGHVIIESGDPTTNVTAQMTYRCVTNRSGQIQEHTEQVEKQERQINELETLVLENIRMNQNRSQNFLTSLISTLEIEEE